MRVTEQLGSSVLKIFFEFFVNVVL
jgi:hypothetical protein